MVMSKSLPNIHTCTCPVCGTTVAAGITGDPLGPCSSCGHADWFRVQEFGNTVVINVLPSFHLERSDIRRVGELLLRGRKSPRILVNLALIQYIGSTFLDRLVLLKRSVTAADGCLILCGLNPIVREIFRITRLDGFFEIRESTEDVE